MQDWKKITGMAVFLGVARRHDWRPPGVDRARALFDRNEDRMPDLAFDVLRQVALPDGVLDQDHFSDADDPTLTVAGGYFDAGVEIEQGQSQQWLPSLATCGS